MKTKRFVTKLVTYPENVWNQISRMVKDQHGLTTPRNEWDIRKFVRSRSFSLKKFIFSISEKQTMMVFTLCCKKLGLGFIPDSNNGWHIVALGETADQLLEFVRDAVIDLAEVVEESQEVVPGEVVRL